MDRKKYEFLISFFSLFFCSITRRILSISLVWSTLKFSTLFACPLRRGLSTVEGNQQALRLIVLLLFSFCRKLICSFQNEVMMSFTQELIRAKNF